MSRIPWRAVVPSVVALVVAVATLAVEGKALAQTAETVSIGTVGLLPGGTGKQVPVTVSNLNVGAGDEGLGVLTFEFVWDKSVIDVVGFTPVLDTQEYNVSANLVASTSTGQFLPAPFGGNTGRGIVSVDWASLPPPDAVSSTFTVGNIIVDAAAGVTVGMSTPVKLAVTEFATNSNVDPIQGYAEVDGQVSIVDEVTIEIPMSVGFNLIGIPVLTDTQLKAADLAGLIQDQAGQVVSIRAFSGSFISWTPANVDFNNFEINPGDAFFVQLAVIPNGGIFEVTGSPIEAPVVLDLGVGFNLVNFPVTQAATAADMATAVTNAFNPSAQVSDVVVSIRAFSGSFISWTPANVDFNNFTVDPAAGYFVQLSQAVQGFSPQAATQQGSDLETQAEEPPPQSCRGTRWIVDYLLFSGPLQFLLPMPCIDEALGLTSD